MRAIHADSAWRFAAPVAVLILFVAVRPGSAGIYSSPDVVVVPEESHLNPDDMRITLADRRFLLTALTPDPSRPNTDGQKKLLKETLKRKDELMAKVKAGTATSEDQLNLSAVQFSLGQTADVIALLQPLTQRYREDRDLANRDPWRALIHANLATAYQLNGDPGQAIAQLTEAKTCWPDELPGFTPARLKWYKQLEKLQRNLLFLRMREQSTTGGKPAPTTTVDQLFEGVDWVGEDGKFTPGKLAAEQQKKLPKEALGLVQQLILWLPADDRLYWLYGELLNARGDMSAALQVFVECVDARRMGAPELMEHRRSLQESLSKPQLPAASNLPDASRVLWVGIGAGIVVAALLYLQLREFSRRWAR